MIENKLKLALSTLALLIIATLTINTAFAQLHVVKEQTDNQGNIISEAGYVGIGTEVPTEKLEVDGKIKAKGEIKLGTAMRNGNHVSRLVLGDGRTTKGPSFINLITGTENQNTAQFVSTIDGEGESSSFHHYGDGKFSLRTWNPDSYIQFVTSKIKDPNKPVDVRKNTDPIVALKIVGKTGNVGIGNFGLGEDQKEKLHVKGNALIENMLFVDGTARKPGGGEFETTSDKRTKKNINTYKAGLEDLLKLNPVTYNYNGKAGISDTEKTHVGLIAQEFAEIAPYAVHKFEFTEEESNKTEEYMSLDASSIKYMLVNAVKEQQALIDAQQSQLEKQKILAEVQQEEIENLKIQLSELAKNNSTSAFPTNNEMNVLLEGTGTETALLAQNSPNPFTLSTRIEYFIPANSRHCRMSFRDMNGKEMKQVNIEHNGVGAIELSAKDLAAGIYSYVLYVNGDIVASKKMIMKD